MAIPHGNRDVSVESKNSSEAIRRQQRGALRAALIIGSIIALFVLLSLIRPMPAKNVLGDDAPPFEASAPQQ